MRARIPGFKKMSANFSLDRSKDVAVDKIEQIDCQEQHQRGSGASSGTLGRFHRELPIADCRILIVNHKRCLTLQSRNARSIFLPGRWCVASTESTPWASKTCRKAGFYSSLTPLPGLTPLFSK